ncbi:hypothetical protein [Mixta mediterraneensis]|nr:hypothetical protein [Mixta mediterraneensis]
MTDQEKHRRDSDTLFCRRHLQGLIAVDNYPWLEDFTRRKKHSES